MIDNYLNAELILNSQNDNNNGNKLELLINSTDEVSTQYPKSVSDSIKEAFEKKKNKVIVTNGDVQKFLIALPKTDL